MAAMSGVEREQGAGCCAPGTASLMAEARCRCQSPSPSEGRHSSVLREPQSHRRSLIPTFDSFGREKPETHRGKASTPAKPCPDRRYIKQSPWAPWFLGKSLGPGPVGSGQLISSLDLFPFPPRLAG